MAKKKLPPALKENKGRLKKGEPLKKASGALGHKPKNVTKRSK